MRSSHTLRGGRLPAALALIGLALLGLLFVPECDDCYFVYWSFDSLRDWLLTRPSTAGAEIVGVPENGLEPFVYNETLAETARAHSQDMIDRDFFDHTNPDGKSPFDRMRENGLSYSMAAENIAVGYPSPEAVVEGWMNSEGHRANILGGCEELGVGLALGGSYGYYWTQCFATVR